ncbi:MAG: translocation/assembly module TamB domain-containing protein [Gammaproteobacteria bacterium]
MSALRGLATLVVALTILAVLGLVLIATPAGSAWLVGAVADLAGDRLALTGVRGTLLEGLAVDRLKLVAGRTSVVIEPAELSMSWPDLLRRRLRLTTVRADTVRIDIAPRPPDEPRSVVQPLLLPIVIATDSLEIGRLIIRNGVSQDGGTVADIVPVEIGPVVVRGELADGNLRFESLRAELYGVGVDASGTLGTGEPFALDAALWWQAPEAGATGSGRLSGDLSALRVEQVVRVPSLVSVGGVVQLLQDQPVIFAEARWKDFQKTLGAGPALLLRSESGSLRIRGWTDGYTGDTDATLRLGDRPKVRLRANAAGDRGQARLPDIRIDGFGGQVTANGGVAWRDGLSGAFRVAGKRINPGALDPRFKGQVDFTGELGFDGAGNFRVVLPGASGTLFQRPLRASGTVARQDGVLAFDDVRINAGANRVELSGTWGEKIAGQFRVDAPDLATLWPGYQGQLRGSGRVGGTTARPTFDVGLTGSNLATGDLRIRSLSARGGLGARQKLDLDARADGLAWSGQLLGDLSTGISGRLDSHVVDLSLTGGEVGAAIRTSGSYRNGIVTETLGSGTVTIRTAQRWTLREPATVRVASPDISVSAHCWTSGDAELCVADSRYRPQEFSAGVDLRQFPLTSLAPWLPADIGLAGTATASLAVQGDPRQLEGSLRGALRASLADAVITWRVPDDEDVQTELTEFRVDASLAGNVLDFDAAVAESFGLRLTTTGKVTDPLGVSPVIVAEVAGGVPDLASLGPVLERLVDVGDVQGRITVAATLTGNARRPDIAGGLALEDGAFTVPAAGIRVDRISLALQGREDGQVALTGNARSGKGFVALDGALAWRDQLLPSAEATVKGRVIDVINLPEGFVQVSPDVRVVLRDGQFRVSGEMLVPKAAIKLKKIEEGPVRPSPDTIVHGRDLVAVAKAPPLFVLDGLQVRLGKKVSFEGFGLKTGLVGGLRLNQSLGADPTLVTGDGVVSLEDGQFTAFGQKLEIERGSLIFSGVVTDPGLDVKASRDVDYEGREVTVGVLLSGNLSRIQTRVFSEPAMGELDALSYLTTGKPLSAAGAGDRSLVASSAISLGLSQALPVVQQLGSALSVDEVAFGTSDSGDTAVVVGEQLGKNLFIRYSYGIFDKLGTVQATYKLGRRLSIEGSSGEEQALDLIYSINW